MNIPDYSQYSFEDFILDADFRAWVLTPNAESGSFWETYLSTHPEQQQTIQEAIWVVQHLQINAEAPSQDSKQRVWQSLSTRFDEQQKSQQIDSTRKPTDQWLYWQRWAAVITLLFTFGILSWYLTQPHTRHIQTAYGETRQLVLPDGSQVLMNSNSSLTFHDDWSQGQQREVWLEGEAFFKVAKQYDSRHHKVKFVTHTTQLDVLVVGTQFNVHARRGKTEVMLLEGKVQLTNPLEHSGPVINVQPGQLASRSEGVEKVHIRREKAALHTGWVKKSFVFENTPLAEIAIFLKDNYGLEVIFEDQEMMDYRLTANLTNQDLKTLLQVIGASFHLDVKQTKEQIKFQRK